MQRACFLHQLCSSGSSVTESWYLLPGCVPAAPGSPCSMSPGKEPGPVQPGSQEGWSRAARGAGISPAAQPGVLSQ